MKTHHIGCLVKCIEKTISSTERIVTAGEIG